MHELKVLSQSVYLLIDFSWNIIKQRKTFPPLHLGFVVPVLKCSSGTVHSGYKGQVCKGQPIIRDRLAGTE